jgi:predicted transcriptional regulator of viral defense system
VIDHVKRLKQGGIVSLFRPGQAQQLGLNFETLKRLTANGAIERVSRGLYRLRDAEMTEHYSIAAVCARAPRAVVCLLSALNIHGIGTQVPHEVWIAIDRKARKPGTMPVKIRVVRFSGAMLKTGIVTRRILGVPVRLTSPARTVVDCFRYRNKFGLDVALEALRDTLRSKLATVDEIMRAAAACRARTVMRTYLEAVSL